jgi:hypothetical protein
MKTQIKQLLYGILATSCFGLSCTSSTWAAEEYHWPPKDGEPIVTLVGPVYETGSETKAPLFKALEEAMASIVENQQTHLPGFYQQRIAGMNHQLFRPGYSNEEEWGSIKSLSSKAEDYDTERMAGILESSENRKPGLEMAIRMQPISNQNPASVTLEGYRFVLQPGGKGQAEWFTQVVKLTGREVGEEFRNALVWLLAKPFGKQKSFVLENVEVPAWEGKNTAGLLKFADTNFTADANPIRKETVKACVQTRFCPEIKIGGDEFALISNIADAQVICRMFERVVIDENTLLRLSLNKNGRTLLDRGNGAAWHSGGQTGYFKEHYNHQEFIQAETGVVWCKHAKLEASPTFVEHPPKYLIDQTGLSLSVYRMFATGKYWLFGKSMVVESLGQYSERTNIRKFLILDNALASDVQEMAVVSSSAFDFGYVPYNIRFRGLVGSSSSGDTKVTSTSFYGIWKNYGIGMTTMSYKTKSSSNNEYEMINSTIDFSYTYGEVLTATLGVGNVTSGSGTIFMSSSGLKYSTDSVSGKSIFVILGIELNDFEGLFGFTFNTSKYSAFQSQNSILQTDSIDESYSISGGQFMLGVGFIF